MGAVWLTLVFLREGKPVLETMSDLFFPWLTTHDTTAKLLPRRGQYCQPRLAWLVKERGISADWQNISKLSATRRPLGFPYPPPPPAHKPAYDLCQKWNWLKIRLPQVVASVPHLCHRCNHQWSWTLRKFTWIKLEKEKWVFTVFIHFKSCFFGSSLSDSHCRKRACFCQYPGLLFCFLKIRSESLICLQDPNWTKREAFRNPIGKYLIRWHMNSLIISLRNIFKRRRSWNTWKRSWNILQKRDTVPKRNDVTIGAAC